MMLAGSDRAYVCRSPRRRRERNPPPMARLSEIAILSDTVHWFDGDGLDSPTPPPDRPGDLSAFTGWQPTPPVPCPNAAAKAAATPDTKPAAPPTPPPAP